VTAPDRRIPRDVEAVRVAIAGMGKMGHLHLRALRQLAGGQYEPYYKGHADETLCKLRVVAVCDPDPDRLADVGDLPGFANLPDLFDAAGPHLLVVTAPTRTHFELAGLALDRGVHTFVEKPLTDTAERARQLADRARQAGLKLLAAHVERYNPVAIKLRRDLAGRNLAEATYAFHRAQPHDPRIPDDIITDKAVHDLDLAVFFFGPIRRATLRDLQRRNGRVFQTRLDVEHENGTRGELLVSWLVERDKTRRLELRAGSDCWRGDFVNKQLRRNDQPIACEVPGYIEPLNNQIKDELVDFILYATFPDPDHPPPPPLLSLPEVLHTLELLDDLHRQAERA
jgi:predicted dehydrogenase